MASDLTPAHVLSVLTTIGRHTVPAAGQRELNAEALNERAADWWMILSGMGVGCADLSAAASRCIASSRWRPEIADIVAALRGPEASRQGTEAIAAEDLAALDRWADVVASMGGVVPEWSAVRAAVSDPSRPTRALVVFGDPARVDRIAAAVMRLGGWSAVVRARTGERLPGSDPWRDYGFAWRSLYAGTDTAEPSARMLTGHATRALGDQGPPALTDREATTLQAELAHRLARRG